MASAAIVTGSWDPPLPNPPFTDLGWMTTINLQIPTGCFRADGSTPAINYISVMGNGFDCGPSQGQGQGVTPANFSILSAQIGIYSLVTNRLVDVLTFNPASFELGLVELSPGGFVELRAGDADPVPGTAQIGPAAGPVAGFEFILGLPGAAPEIRYRRLGESGDFTTPAAVPTLIAYAVDYTSSALTVTNRTALRVGDAVAGNTVPEPGSLGLALFALSAAGAVAVRRTRRPLRR